jgi:hypothetical protein
VTPQRVAVTRRAWKASCHSRLASGPSRRSISTWPRSASAAAPDPRREQPTLYRRRSRSISRSRGCGAKYGPIAR